MLYFSPFITTKANCLSLEKNNFQKKAESDLIQLRNKLSSLQTELDNSEVVQRDFVKLSQSLQVQLEEIRQATTEVRWQHFDDVGECNSCKRGLNSKKEKVMISMEITSNSNQNSHFHLSLDELFPLWSHLLRGMLLEGGALWSQQSSLQRVHRVQYALGQGGRLLVRRTSALKSNLIAEALGHRPRILKLSI